MTLYILDSDTLRLIRDLHPKVEARVRGVIAPDEMVTTAITVHESVMGWHTYLSQSKSPATIERGYGELARSVSQFARFRILNYDQPAIARWEHLVKLKLNVGNNDLRIAAIALQAGGTVVTCNLRDFQRVPGLVCEDWSA